MKVNRELDALEVMGIDPLSYVVFPRLAGGVISVFCLAIYFNLIAIVGGYFLTIFFHEMDFWYFMNLIFDATEKQDIWMFIVKNLFSGAMIFVIACKQGLSVKRSPHEVPQVTTQAVVKSMIYVVGFNVLISGLFYLHKFASLGVFQ
jgi:phospholipid/cholesterol/gamma-HCH transport system permease protein